MVNTSSVILVLGIGHIQCISLHSHYVAKCTHPACAMPTAWLCASLSFSLLSPSPSPQDESALAKQRASVVIDKIVSLTDERLALVKRLESSVSKGKQVKQAQPVQQEVRGRGGEMGGGGRGRGGGEGGGGEREEEERGRGRGEGGEGRGGERRW